MMFVNFSRINYGKAAIVLGAATALWTGLIEIVPEQYHHIGTVVLGAVTSAVTYLMRSDSSEHRTREGDTQ